MSLANTRITLRSGGRNYNLLLQHRYSDRKLWMKGLLTDAMNPKEVYAYWDMIQQYMDVTGPLPDVPIFEPFRHRDPITEAYDERTGRDPFKWRGYPPVTAEHDRKTGRPERYWRNKDDKTFKQKVDDMFTDVSIIDTTR